MPTLVKFSQNIVPLKDLKTNPGRVVKHAAESRHRVLVTNRGRGVAVMQSVTEFEAAEDERTFTGSVSNKSCRQESALQAPRWPTSQISGNGMSAKERQVWDFV